jgi:hypothetical protein
MVKKNKCKHECIYKYICKHQCKKKIEINPFICYLYGQNFELVELNYLAPRLINIIFEKEFLISSDHVKTLQINTNDKDSDTIKRKNVEMLTYMKNKYNIKVFSSELGSEMVEYLDNIFFSQNLDCLHISSGSTATSLSQIPNLMRLLPPDTINPIIFVKLTEKDQDRSSNRVFVVHDDEVYSAGLSSSIIQKFSEISKVEVIDYPILINKMTDNDIIAKTRELVSMMKDDDMLIYVINNVKGPVFFNALADNNDVPESLRILGGDAGGFGDEEDFFNRREARIIQPFKGADLLIQDKLQKYLDESLIADPIKSPSDSPNATTKISNLISYMVKSLDLAFYIAKLPSTYRLLQTRYIDILFDKNLDVANGSYGVDDLNDSNITYAIASVYGIQLYITNVEE